MIKVLSTLKELTQIKQEKDLEYALVPTMGNLHEGHLNLVRLALKDFETVIISIFVNPLQFGPNEDFQKYPRTLEEDIRLLESLINDDESKEIIVFAPASPKVMYPNGHQTSIRNREMDKILCGKSRPGHFEGVCTVVYRLFQLIRPHSAYFGLKDFQQVKTIKRMNQDLMLGVNIIECPITRDHNGLALSSRNRFLSIEEKEEALILNQSLNRIAENLKEKTWSSVEHQVNKLISETKSKKYKSLKWDYLEVRENDTLREPIAEDNQFTVFGSVYLGTTRLIDNVEVRNNIC